MNARKLVPLLVVIAGLLAWRNSFIVPFVFDDTVSILDKNDSIRHLWPLWGPLSPPHGGSTVDGRPVLNFSFALNYAAGGVNPWGYHALNLAIHILAGLTLYGVVRRTLLRPAMSGRFGPSATSLALAVAVIWTVHPLQTEAVTYVSQRAESLMGLFYLLTMYCFIRGVESPKPGRWYALSVTACLLGMGAKEVMVSAPLMVLLYDGMFVADGFRQAWKRRWRLYAGLAGTWILLGYLVATASTRGGSAGFGGEIGWWEYALTQCRAVVRYLKLSVWPCPLVFDYGKTTVKHVGQALPYALVLAALAVGTMIALWRRRPVGFLGLWFFAILAPSSSVVPVMFQTVAEHRMYLPLAAVVALAVPGLYAWIGRRSLPVFAVLALALGFLTYQRNEDYRSDLALWSDTVAKCPDNPGAQSNLALALVDAGQVPEAIGHFEQAIRLQPDFAPTHSNLGLALAGLGRFTDAIQQYREALRLDPNSAELRINLAVALFSLGNAQEAIGQYEAAIRLQPDNAAAHNDLGTVLASVGRSADAIQQYQEAVRLQPDYAAAHNSLAHALARAGRVEEAIQQYQETLRSLPDNAEVHNNLAAALTKAGRFDEAIAHFQQALRIDPNLAEAHYNLGITLEKAGRAPEAIEHYQQALRLRPDLTAARSALARLQPRQ